MKVLVCVKLVPERISFDFQRKQIVSSGWTVNLYDMMAVRAGLILKETLGWTLHGVTIAPPESESGLYPVFFLGVEVVYRIWGSVLSENMASGCLDTYTKATIIAQFASICENECNIVLCGRKSVDTGNEQFGAYLAHKLGVPYISRVVGIEIEGDSGVMLIHRKLEGRFRESYRIRSRAVLGIEEIKYEPSLMKPLTPNIISVEVSEFCDIRSITPQIGIVEIAQVRPRTRKLTSTDKLSFLDKVRLAGGISDEKKAEILNVTPLEGAKLILQKLEQIMGRKLCE